MDIMFFILLIILVILFIFISLSLFEKDGLKYMYIIYNILSFLLSFKIIELASVDINANIVISSLFSILTYIIVIKTTKEEYKNLTKQTLWINIIVSLFILLTTLYIGTVSDNNAVSIKYLFLDNYKILLTYPIITLINQLVIFLIYNNIKDLTESVNKNIIIASLTTLMLESLLFNIFSYIFELPFKEIIVLILSNYLIKVLLTMIYIFLVKFLTTKKKVKL